MSREPRYSVIDGLSTPEDAANGIHSRQWLVVEVDGCTCGAPGYPPGHYPGCGTEPIGKITDILAQVEAMQRRIAELEAQAQRDRAVIEAALDYEKSPGIQEHDRLIDAIRLHDEATP